MKKIKGGGNYEDCEENQGGYVSLFANFTKPQNEELSEDEFFTITESTATEYNQKVIDQQMDAAFENPAYSWINAGDTKRELVNLPCNSFSGYVISKGEDRPSIFFSLYNCVNLRIFQYTFIPWKEVQKRVDRWQRQQNFKTSEITAKIRTTVAGAFDFSKIKFGVKS
ncbi:MAG: hypothetical protein LBS28_01030 [Streptococcaceae bacterium]|jgi:hypothetical protein|nr:hypothetical protein [Streptococcaceae bacterium]